ncbi:hypothetical protein evm_007785 [Chilo suppressalis]|nr:hypothetical protein evm_007785 [Chilo suppressalis]
MAPAPPGSGRRDPMQRSPTGTTVNPEIMRDMLGQPRELFKNARVPVLCHGRPAGARFYGSPWPAGRRSPPGIGLTDASLDRIRHDNLHSSSGCILADPETPEKHFTAFSPCARCGATQTPQAEHTEEIEPVDETEIIEQIKKIKMERSPDTNRITNEVIKIGQPLLVKPLTILFNMIVANNYKPSKEVDLEINLNKTKAMTNSSYKLEDVELEYVSDYIYSEKQIPFNARNVTLEVTFTTLACEVNNYLHHGFHVHHSFSKLILTMQPGKDAKRQKSNKYTHVQPVLECFI